MGRLDHARPAQRRDERPRGLQVVGGTQGIPRHQDASLREQAVNEGLVFGHGHGERVVERGEVAPRADDEIADAELEQLPSELVHRAPGGLPRPRSTIAVEARAARVDFALGLRGLVAAAADLEVQGTR